MKKPWQVMTGGDWLVILTLLGISSAGIVWLAGLEIDHRVRVRNETRKILKIEIGES